METGRKIAKFHQSHQRRGGGATRPTSTSAQASQQAAIDPIFNSNGQSLAFDLAGLDLGSLALILPDLQYLRVSNGKLTGPVA